ncbi:hypothetical protein Pan44_08230 [Caulifigura coniformis]|uniref:Transporter n=1 Tax=Caulifigura coniformis TaxID=2527983 RepID=A0A517S9K4_9PLAN|nr:hypothetical protein [Caulifigura coniformis]QDT52810.1 hypothetical protein Pan44_08230 [Caulifigura coniformis]
MRFVILPHLSKLFVVAAVVLTLIGPGAFPANAADGPGFWGHLFPVQDDPAQDRWLDAIGAEDKGAESHHPRIPEPMVFDLVRPLGAKKGELEINVLGLIPLNRRVGLNKIPNPIGLVPGERHDPEWAPEIEYAIADGVAVEFELPFEGDELAAYKAAVQVTFGTAFDDKFIHGTQAILLYDIHSAHYSPTFLYLAGLRFDERWSMLAMVGLRTEINGPDVAERTERLVNASLFYDLNEQITLGVETDYAQSLSGGATWLVIPQIHWEISDHWMLQSGAGVNFTKDYSLPEAAIRLIRSF